MGFYEPCFILTCHIQNKKKNPVFKLCDIRNDLMILILYYEKK